MKKFIVLVAVVVVGALIVGCASDIVLPKPPTLAGNYYGKFVRTDQGGSGVKQEQEILWQFTDQTWNMDIDIDNMTDFKICQPYGRYSLTDRVRLTVDQSLPLGGEHLGSDWSSCNPGLNPEGLFTLTRLGDTLVLS